MKRHDARAGRTIKPKASKLNYDRICPGCQDRYVSADYDGSPFPIIEVERCEPCKPLELKTRLFPTKTRAAICMSIQTIKAKL